MSLPSWLQSHLDAVQPHRYTFDSFADEVARLMRLPSPLITAEFERSSDTDHVSMVWKFDVGGAILLLSRPHGKPRGPVVIKVWWSQAPDPGDVVAMVRAYQRRGRSRPLRSLLSRVLRRG